MVEEKIKEINGEDFKETCVQTDKQVRCNVFSMTKFGKEMDEWTKELISELVD